MATKTKNYTITYRGIKITQSNGNYKFKLRGDKTAWICGSYDQATGQIDSLLK